MRCVSHSPHRSDLCSFIPVQANSNGVLPKGICASQNIFWDCLGSELMICLSSVPWQKCILIWMQVHFSVSDLKRTPTAGEKKKCCFLWSLHSQPWNHVTREEPKYWSLPDPVWASGNVSKSPSLDLTNGISVWNRVECWCALLPSPTDTTKFVASLAMRKTWLGYYFLPSAWDKILGASLKDWPDSFSNPKGSKK